MSGEGPGEKGEASRLVAAAAIGMEEVKAKVEVDVRVVLAGTGLEVLEEAQLVVGMEQWLTQAKARAGPVGAPRVQVPHGTERWRVCTDGALPMKSSQMF